MITTKYLAIHFKNVFDLNIFCKNVLTNFTNLPHLYLPNYHPLIKQFRNISFYYFDNVIRI